MTYTYDVLNRLASAKDNRVTTREGRRRLRSTATIRLEICPGTRMPLQQTGNIFDSLNRLTQTCTATSAPASSAGQKLASYTYTLGNAGNRTAVAEQRWVRV